MSKNFQTYLNRIRRFFSDDPDAADADFSKMVNEMEVALRDQKNNTSYAIALADEKRKEIEKLVAEIEGNKSLAEQFIRAGDKAKSEHCIKKQIIALRRLESEKNNFSELQSRATISYNDFLNAKKVLEQSKQEVLQHKSDQRTLHAQQRLEALTGSSSMIELKSQFDDQARELRIELAKQRNLRMLEGDSGSDMDSEIASAIEANVVKDALIALEKRVQNDAVVEIPYSIENDPLASTIELLKKGSAWAQPTQDEQT